ncbi:MAG: cytochrome c maturation protein CcmE [Rhodospirillaceae bacterium]|nr:cytochrome c maturation protein CcmE [Rhodospirillaceae bacterium]
MKPKNKRLSLIVATMTALAASVALILVAFEDNVVFFYSPSDLLKKRPSPTQKLRIGGLVKKDSIRREPGVTEVSFEVTDLNNSVPVVFNGILPDLFREEQGVVAEGRYREQLFYATQILAKHDEQYMPPEVAESLKKSGKWKGPVELEK